MQKSTIYQQNKGGMMKRWAILGFFAIAAIAGGCTEGAGSPTLPCLPPKMSADVVEAHGRQDTTGVIQARALAAPECRTAKP